MIKSKLTPNGYYFSSMILRRAFPAGIPGTVWLTWNYHKQPDDSRGWYINISGDQIEDADQTPLKQNGSRYYIPRSIINYTPSLEQATKLQLTPTQNVNVWKVEKIT